MHLTEVLDKLKQSLGLSDSEFEDFLNPDYGKLHDPLLLPDMEKARDRVIQAVDSNEHIVVYSDYDADGIPGAVVMSDFFKRIGYDNVSFYIPHRHDEGFGLNTQAVEECSTRGAKLLITVDCGIADLDEVAHANSLGMDVIVTDHHEPGEALPSAYAVVDPKRKDSKYPFKELCGSAVAYKLVQAIGMKKSFGVKEGMEKWSLDMVGIATLSDMVPLVGENRVLARFGLDVLRKSPRPGLSALFDLLRMEQRHVSEDDITFMITPRINAASRMGVPMDAFKLLSTSNESEAKTMALHLEKINKERKTLVAGVVKDARKHMAMRESVASVVVIGNPEWRPAILGLVANSLVEEYQRPVFVWGRDGDGTLKGSCRSFNGCNLHDLMTRAGDSFVQYGGHAGAGGFSVTLESLTTLEDNLSTCFSEIPQTLVGEHKGPVSAYPVEIGNIDDKLWDMVSAFAPFGMSNPKPVFEIVGDIKSARQFGKESNHLELVLTNGDKNVKAIAFFATLDGQKVSLIPGAKVKLLANLEKSYFLNRPELQLRIVDISSAV